jgi:hypothetical protein
MPNQQAEALQGHFRRIWLTMNNMCARQNTMQPQLRSVES